MLKALFLVREIRKMDVLSSDRKKKIYKPVSIITTSSFLMSKQWQLKVIRIILIKTGKMLIH